MARVKERAAEGLDIAEARGEECRTPAPFTKAGPLSEDIAGWPEGTDGEQHAGTAERRHSLRHAVP